MNKNMIQKIINYTRYGLIMGWVMGGFTLSCWAQETDTTGTKTFLEEKIPIAFGKFQTRKTTTAAISTVNSEVLKRFNTPSLGNTLFGQLAGLHVSQNGSALGNNDAPALAIRGRQTFQDNSVLVLVDGFETNWNNIIPEEIESISVLKDAGALALYGMDGANNVLLITTKRGQKSGKTAINFNARIGLQSPTVLPEFLDNGDYAELYNRAIVSDGRSIQNGLFKSDTIVNYFKTGQFPYLYPNVDWYKEVLKPNALSQDYTLSFSGGKTDARYFVAMGFADYRGIYANTESQAITNSNYNLKRYNLRANFDVNITSFLSAEIGLRGTMIDKYFPNIAENTIWRTMALFNPYPVRTEDGNWGGTQGYTDNPVASILQKGYQSINDRTVDANVKLIGKLDAITVGLRIFGQVNFHNFFFDTYNKTRNYGYQELVPRPDLIIPGTTPPNTLPFDKIARGATDNNFVISQGNGNQVNRTNIIGGLEFDRQFGNSHIYMSSMYFQELYRTNGADAPFAKQRIMGRAAYNLSEKYFAELGYSYSGSENFPKEKRFGFFPSFSAGWIMSNEGFLSQNKMIDFLKLRGSVGILGNDNVGSAGRFIFNQFYFGSGNYLIGNNLGVNAPTFTQDNLANPNVTWEKALRANFGFDAILWKNMRLTLDYFRESRNDIYINPANYTPSVLGANFNNVNRGETQATGGELDLMFDNKRFYIGGNVSYAKNKIINIEEPVIPETYLYAKGNAINQPFVLEAIGFFKDAADIANSPKQLFGNITAGDIKYKDQNTDGVIDNRDRMPIGKTALPNLWYGFNTGARFAGFDCHIFLQGATQRTVSLLDNGSIVPFLNGGVRPTQWVKDNYWTPTKGNTAQFPRLTTEQNDNNYRASTLWQRNGSFIRLRNVELGYTLPESLTQKLKLNTLRMFISANNLLTIDKIDELPIDPEIMNLFVHPSMKAYNFGITLKL